MSRQIVKGLRKVLLTRRKSKEYEKVSLISNEDQTNNKSKDTKSDRSKEKTENNEVVGTPGMNWTGEDKARLEYVMIQNNLREYNLLW